MLVRIDPSLSTPLSDQVASSVRRAMAEGDLQQGQRLPAAREVARSLGVNMHTVLRGYQILRDEGLIELRPGRGAVVTAVTPQSRAALFEKARQLVADARSMGLSEAETLALVSSCMSSPAQV
ncbi:GntR family transcriptional regulator [Streptomyces alboflavus]|uniref:GntR family transcriptional regulator n=1 Tax=Streptomyces alboflavus TaxID=67267 RepID=UPI000997C294|nr:GntR family transcriptional regulator [Streptomyces alboflavus]